MFLILRVTLQPWTWSTSFESFEYAFDLCLGWNEKLSGVGPSSMVVIFTQSSEFGELSSVSRLLLPT